MHKYQRGEKCLVMSRDEVRAFDSWAINELGVPGVVLMENAGRSCAELIMQRLAGRKGAEVCIFCGTGNNGGDGFVVARHLLNERISVRVVVCGEPSKIRGDAKINLDLLIGLKHGIEQLDLATAESGSVVARLCAGADIVVDAVFGTGLRGELSEEYCRLIETINGQGIPIVAVDIPSGLDCDTGKSLGAVIKAESTVTFAAVKKGFTENPESARYTGAVYIASIGVEPQLRRG